MKYKPCGGCLPSNWRKQQVKTFGELGDHLLFTPSQNISLSVFNELRSQNVDENECHGWSLDMAEDAESAPDVHFLNRYINTIRMGVPDALKHIMWLRSCNARTYMETNPTFYDEVLYQTFGMHLPTQFGGNVPTFSGGILGYEEEIKGQPIDLVKWEVDLEIDKIESEGFSHKKLSWSDLSTTHFAPHSPQILRHENPTPPRFSVRRRSAKRSWWPSFLAIKQSDKAHKQKDSTDGSDTNLGLSYTDTIGSTDCLSFNAYQCAAGTAAPIPWTDTASKDSMGDSDTSTEFPMIYIRSGDQPEEEPPDYLNSLTAVHSNIPRAIIVHRSSSSSSLASCPATTGMNMSLKLPDKRSQRAWSASNLIEPYSGKASKRGEFGAGKRKDGNRVRDGKRESDQLRSLTRLGASKQGVYRLEAVAPFSRVLSNEGFHICKRILWCINCTFSQVDFCPILPSLIVMLVMYLTERQAFAVIRCLLRRAVEARKVKLSRPVVIYQRSDFIRNVKVTQALALKFIPRIVNRLNELEVDQAAWFARALQDGLVRILPFNYVMRILGSFLFEGSKVLQRYSLAVLKLCEDSILSCETKYDVNRILAGSKFEDDDAEQLNTLTETAFAFDIKSASVMISKYTASDIPTGYLTCVRSARFARPRMFDFSKIVSDIQWETIWYWLPQECRCLDPKKCYSSDRDGMSIVAIQKSVWNHIDSPMIFFVLTTHEEVIGAYSPFPFRSDARLIDDKDKSSTFVFKLHPPFDAYWWTGQSKFFMNCTIDSISIGANDPAIVLDSWLKHGNSKPCTSFGSPQLAGSYSGDFDVKLMEIWLLM